MQGHDNPVQSLFSVKEGLLEVHLLLSGLLLPHGSTCLSDGPSSTSTFSSTFPQLPQLTFTEENS